jgi:thymidylate kinase
MDFETAEFYGRVREEYLRIADREPGRFRVIDADASFEAIHAEVVRLVGEIL